MNGTYDGKGVGKKAVLISCFNWYKTRLEPIRDILLGEGFRVTVLIADFDHIKKATIDPRYDECTYIAVPAYKRNLSLRRIRSHMSFGKSVSQWLKENKPELVYVQVPPNNVAKTCMEYKKRHPNTKLVMDVIDLWPESMPIGVVTKTPPARKWRSWRDDCIAVSDYVFTECGFYQTVLADKLDSQRTSTLYLFKDQTPDEVELVRKLIDERIPTSSVVRLAYLGSMNNIIDIDGIVKVIELIQALGRTCELRAIGDGEGRSGFQEAVAATGCGAHFYGAVFDEMTKIKLLAPCDYGLNMMKGTSAVGLSIKSVDYLSYGLPLINNIKGDTWGLVSENPIGINFNGALPLMSEYNHKDVIKIFDSMFTRQVFVNSVVGKLGQIWCDKDD